MGILLALLDVLLGILLLLVLVPFRVRAAGAVHDGLPAGEARADWGPWLLGAVVDTDRRVTVRLLGLPVARFIARAGAKRDRRRARSPRKAKRAREGGALRRLQGAVAHREHLQRMAGRLLRALHPRLRATGRVGVGDPADTVALHALLAALGAVPGVELAIELDWVEEALELELELEVRIWIAELLAVAALLLLARSHRRALRMAFGRAGT